MGIGRTIKIYLDNGSVTSIRHSEIVNWSGQAMFIPRAKIPELDKWEESKRPGVYLLFGVDEETGKPAIYIGESENILARLQQHWKNKDFWNEAVLFTSKDDNLTKSHVKYLEAKLIELSKLADRYVLLSGNDATLSSLPRGDRDAMDEFLNNIRLLLGTMGHKTLEPVYQREITDNSSNSNKLANIEFTLRGKIPATAIYSSEGIVVKQGSKAKINDSPSLPKGYKLLKENLVEDNTLQKETDSLYVFTKDYVFTSSSQAAAVILGISVSGPPNWVNGQMKLSEYEKENN